MITFLKGTIFEKDFGYIVIDVNGVGYSVNITLDTYFTNEEKSDAFIYIYHHIWQDGQELYGFTGKTERSVFKKMIAVSGVGPKLACRILQNVESQKFISLISGGQTDKLTKINGLGKKTAEKLVFELKDKFIKEFSGVVTYSQENTELMETAVMALVSLGYKESQVRNVIAGILEVHKHISIEDLIKEGLAIVYGK